MKKSILIFGILIFGFSFSKSVNGQERIKTSYVNSALPEQSFQSSSSNQFQPAYYEQEGISSGSELFPATDTTYTFEDGALPTNFDPYIDGTKFGRTTSSNAWYIEQSVNTYNSSYSIRTGVIGASENTNTGTWVHIGDAGGTLQFKRRVSTEQDADYFILDIAGEIVDSLSGDIPWSDSPVYDLPAGEYYIDFWYTKNESIDDPNGIDAVFLDDIQITGLDTTPVKISNVQPNAASPFSTINIYGSGFSPAALNVYFGDTEANIVGYSNTRLIVDVPQTDIGFNDLKVSNYYGSDTYPNFSVLNATEINYQLYSNTLPQLDNGTAEFADVDDDGDMDLVLAGASEFNGVITDLYLNDGNGNYSISSNTFEAVGGHPSAEFGDVNGDGAPDLLISGSNPGNKYTDLYINDGNGIFTNTGQGFEGLNKSSSSFGDVDGDGDLDFIITGQNSSGQSVSRLYVNNDGNGDYFISGNTFTNVDYGGTAFSDVNNDGFLDLTIVGSGTATVYLNDGNGNFDSGSDAGLESVSNGSITFGDANSDNYPDALITGNSSSGRSTTLYFNDGDGTFTDSGVTLTGVQNGDGKFGDLDGDGDQDIIITGLDGASIRRTLLYVNDGSGSYADANAGLESAAESSLEIADIDGDADLDIFIHGRGDSGFVGNVYKNEGDEVQTYVTRVTPEAAIPGEIITVYGSGFNSSTEVFIDGVVATTESTSSTKVTVTVPSTFAGPATLVAQTDGDVAEYSGLFTVLGEQPAFFEKTEIIETDLTSYSSLLEADYDKDGDFDVLGSTQNGTVYDFFWWQNDGSGNFTQQTSFSSTYANYAVSADFNKDSYEDLVYFTTIGIDTLAYIPNNGNGNFGSKTVITRTSSSAITGLKTEDVNYDGFPDIITYLSNVNDISLFLNNGDGTFGAEQFIDQNVTVRDISFEDFNNDNYADLIVAGNNSIRWYSNNGTGAFTFQSTLASGFNYGQVTTSDVNNDGNPDIITGYSSGIGYLINNGNSTFGAHVSLDNGSSAYNYLAARDVDGDGDEDFIATISTNNLVWIDKIGPFEYGNPIPISTYPVRVNGIADFNSDGDTDLILYAYSSAELHKFESVIPEIKVAQVFPEAAAPGSEIEIIGKGFSKELSSLSVSINGVEATILETAGPGTYSNKLTVEVPEISFGSADISITSGSKNTTVAEQFTVLKTEDAYFTSQNVVYSQPQQPYISVFGDLNGDGYDDIIAWSNTNDNLDWFQNDQSGGFEGRTPIASGINTTHIEIEDFDNDGDNDIIILDGSNRSIRVYPNVGSGLFSTPYDLYDYPVEEGISPTFRGFKLIDVDGDGYKDLVLGLNYSQFNQFSSTTNYYWQIVWHKNNNDDTIGPLNTIYNYGTTSFSSNVFTDFDITDYDGDGDQDALVAESQGERIRLYENNGFGAFTGSDYQYVNGNDNIYDIEAADFNNDGFKDIIMSKQYVGTSFNNNISVTQSNGSASPPLLVLDESSGNATSLKVLDFNGDGNYDILAAYSGTDEIKLYLTDGTAVIDTIVVANSSTIDTPRFIDASDVDLDGDLDVVSASSSDNKIAWYENEAPPLPLTSIADARDLEDNETIRIQGIITRKYENVHKIQQDDAGLHVWATEDFNTPLFNANVQIGDSVEIIGTLGEVTSLRELTSITEVDILSSDNVLPDPIPLVLSEVSDFEQYESVLVSVDNLSTNNSGEVFTYNTSYNLFEDGSAASIPLVMGAAATTMLDGTIIPPYFTYTGVVYQNSSTGTDGYSLYPIISEDITATAPNTVISIEEAKSFDDSTLVRVKGVAITPNLQGSTGRTNFFIQDGDAGINIYHEAAEIGGISVGDSVEVSGSLETYNNLREIGVENLNDITILNSGNNLPSPREITFEEFKAAGNPETDNLNLQGTLVRINNLITEPSTWPQNTSALSTNVFAETFEDSSISIRLWSELEVTGATPPSFLDIIGVASTFNTSQIVPRFEQDLIEIETPGPQNLIGEVSESSINLEWDPSPAPNIGGYNIYRSTSTFADSTVATKLNTGIVGDTTFTDSNLQENEIYFYRVSAVDSTSFNPTNLSNEVSIGYKLKRAYALSKTAGDVGTDITIYGTNLPTSAGAYSISIGGSTSTITATSARTVTFTIPDVTPGTYPVVVTIDGNTTLQTPDYLTVLNDTPEESGYFQNATEIQTLTGIIDIKSADLDGDEDLDILATSYNENSSGNVEYLENEGNLTFSDPLNIGTEDDSRARNSVYADFDGDGDIDIASIYNQSLAWYENDGTGTFSSSINSIIDQFDSREAYQTQELIAFDADLDGDTDLIHAEKIADNINYYQNNGAGSFSLQQTIDSNAPLISSMAYADIDGDGDMDVLAALQASNQIVRYINNGGVFSASNEITNSVSSPQKVIIGDLDNDGDQDVLSISSGDSKVAWYSNNGGTGSYSTQKIISEDLTNPFTAALADLNGDDLIDVIVATLNGDVVWYENQGSENLANATSLLSDAGELRSLAIADLNENGKLDILAGDFTNNQLLFFQNVDSPPAPPTGVIATKNIGSITLTWEPNSESDLAGYDIFRSTEADDNFISISGGVQTETTFTDTDLANGVTYYYRVASVDVNGTRTQSSNVAVKAISTQIAGIEPMLGVEGTRVRLVGVGFSNINSENTVNFGTSSATIVDSDSSYVSVEVPGGLSGNVEVSITSKGNEYTYPAPFRILTESPGTFSEASTVTGISGIANIGTADLDGNGFGDLIVPKPNNSQIALYFSDGDDPFNRLMTLNYASTVDPKIIRPINIFGDNYPDFVFISDLNNQFVVLKNNGASTSSSFLDPYTITANHVNPTDITPADMNNDGFTDVVISSSGDGKISWYENQSFNSEVAFSSENNIVSSDGQIRSISVADFNDDGFKDIVAAIAGNNQIAWYRNNGNGSYTKISITSNISEPVRVIATDLDNDGDSDIVYVSSDDDLIAAAINSDGSGNFSTINIGTGISGASDVSVGDLNGDGQLDVLTISPNSGEAFWFENNGGNSFSNAITISPEFSGAISIIPYDADGNGQLDVAVRTNSSGVLGVLMNFRITPLEITGILTGTDNSTIRTKDSFSLEFDNSTDISSISDLSTIIEDAMTIRNSDGTTFIANSVDFGADNSIEIGNINLFSLDTLSVQVSSQTVSDNSNGLYFIDVDGDGVQTSADDTYTSAEFYTTMIGDFNYDTGVDFDDLTLFSDGWRNNDVNFETAPLDFASSTFPQARLDTDNDFNVDDIVSFIRFWNLTQDRNSAAKAQEFAAKRQNNSGLQNLADIQSSRMNGKTELDGYSNLENVPAPASSKKATTSPMSDSLQFISYTKDEQTTQYVNNPNSNSAREVTYNFALSHPDSVMALALTIDYDQEKLGIAGIEDQGLFDIHSSNATVFLSHIDSTNGIITLNIANFDQLTSIENREIMSLTFTSLNDLDSDMIITSDIRAKGKPAVQQTAMKAVQVREDLPETFALSQNYPNPFNPTTSIHYELSEQARVNISVFDILGRKVETILDQNGIRPGYYKVQWDASRYASGMYIYVLNVQSVSGKMYSMTKKMLMVK